MKKRKKIKKKAVISLFIILLLIVGGVFIYLYTNNYFKNEVVEEIVEEEIEEEPEDPIKYYSLSIIMGGDALIHSAVYGDAYSNGTYDFTSMLEEIKPIASSYDLAYYNQETILGGTEIGLSTYPCFNSPYEVGDAFVDAGFNVVSLANNHTLDRGSQAIINSYNYWSSKDVMFNGSATSEEEKENIQIAEKNGISYALLSYTTTTNGITRTNDYYVNWYTEEAVKKDVEYLQDKVDVIMVAMHWGVEYNTGVTDNQKEIAKYLASLGVDIVIGCHPHVVEPVEYIDNTLVIYSLGNFISAQRTNEQLSGLLMSATINKVVDTENNTTTISIDDATAQFIYTYSDRSTASRKDFKVYPYTSLNTSLFSDYKSMYETLKVRVTSLDSSINVVELEEE